MALLRVGVLGLSVMRGQPLGPIEYWLSVLSLTGASSEAAPAIAAVGGVLLFGRGSVTLRESDYLDVLVEWIMTVARKCWDEVTFEDLEPVSAPVGAPGGAAER